MDTVQSDILSRYAVRRHRFTRDEYYRLGEIGVLGEDSRVELLEGQLVDRSPAGPREALALSEPNELLVLAVAGRALVRVQNPIGLDKSSEPLPDIIVVRHPWRVSEDSPASRRCPPSRRSRRFKPGVR